MNKVVIVNGALIGDKETIEKSIKQLKEAGVEYFGTAELVTDEDLENAVETISNNITEVDIFTMLELYESHYGTSEDWKKELSELFEMNTGTRIFNVMFNEVLDVEEYDLFSKYTHTNWLVSDQFHSLLSEKMVDKIKNIEEEE